MSFFSRTLIMAGAALALSASAAELAISQNGNFKEMPAFFNLTPLQDGMKIEYNGKSPHSRDLFLKETYPLSGQKFIRLRVDFTKNAWDYSARFMPVLNFVDASGKSLARYDLDFAYLCVSDFTTNWKLGEKSYYHNDFRVPPKAVKLEVGLNCRGNAFAFTLHKVEVTDNGKDQTKAFYRRPAYSHPAAKLSREQAKELLAKRPAMKAGTVKKNDRVLISVNKETVEPVIFKNGPVEGSTPEQLTRDATFRNAGFKIFVVNVPFGQKRGRVRGPVWTGDNQYNVEELEKAVYDVIANAPDAYVMLELHVNPYYEWCINNPDEISCNAKGEKGLFTSRFLRYSNTPPKKDGTLIWQPSLHSKKFHKDTAAALEEVFRRFAKTPAAKATVGVYLNGGIDNQWFSPPHSDLDYSKASVNGFREFVSKKYKGDVNALRKAWKDNTVTFEAVALPTSKEIRYQGFVYDNAKVPDYNYYLQETGTTIMTAFASAVKKGSGGNLLVGSYWPNGGLTSYPASEHCNMSSLLKSKDIDFFSVVPDYYISREPGQAHSLAAYTGSLKLRNKLLVTELDLRTGEMLNWGMWGADYYMETHNAESFRQDLLGYAAWCRALGGGFHAYDLTCGFWDTDAAVKAWQDAVKLANSATGAKAKKNAVAVFTGEESKHFYTQHPSFNTFQYGLREDPITSLRLAGLAYDVYLPEDALNPAVKEAKVLVFADAGFMTAAEAEKIRKTYGNSNRVIVWNYLPGVFTKDNPAKVIGFNIKPDPSVDRKPLSIMKSDDPLVKGLEGFNTNVSTLRPGIHYTVNDPQAKVLAVYRDTNKGAMAVKRYPSHTEVWIGQAGAFTPQLYRNMAKIAGVTPVIDTDEPAYIANGMIAMQASFAGDKTVNLPEGFADFKVFTGQKPLSRSKNQAVFRLKAGETLILLGK